MSIEEKSIAYVLGALSTGERQTVDRERLYDQELHREIERVEQILSGLPLKTGERLPDDVLWNRIVAAADYEQHEMAGKTTESCEAGQWQIHNEGIEVKALWTEKATLIRCQPGAFEEPHQQPDDEDEHIVVIAGDLIIGGRTFATGDYICIPAGSVHGSMRTSGGCIIFTEYSSHM